jgi:hypothetical protein
MPENPWRRKKRSTIRCVNIKRRTRSRKRRDLRLKNYLLEPHPEL